MKVWLSVRIDEGRIDALADHILASPLGLTEDDLSVDDPTEEELESRTPPDTPAEFTPTTD
jgi:hypothetical protein